MDVATPSLFQLKFSQVLTGVCAFALLWALPGCSSGDEHPSVLSANATPGDAGDAATDDAGWDADLGLESGDEAWPEGGGPDAAEALVPATHGTVDLPFVVSATGDGVSSVKQIDVASNVGGYELDAVAHRGFVYQSHDWGSAGYMLYDLISIPPDGSDFAVTYLYCQGGGLPYVYSESFLKPMAGESAAGTCDGVTQATTTTVELPALRARPAFLSTGITITATGLALGLADGQVQLAGTSYELVPFNTVDCASCPGGPWLELHAMMFASQEACFGIVYLFPDDPSRIQLDHVICLPGLERTYSMYDGTWEGTLKPALRHAVPMRPAPPARRGLVGANRVGVRWKSW